jgi:hypothetical protein
LSVSVSTDGDERFLFLRWVAVLFSSLISVIDPSKHNWPILFHELMYYIRIASFRSSQKAGILAGYVGA